MDRLFGFVNRDMQILSLEFYLVYLMNLEICCDFLKRVSIPIAAIMVSAVVLVGIDEFLRGGGFLSERN